MGSTGGEGEGCSCAEAGCTEPGQQDRADSGRSLCGLCYSRQGGICGFCKEPQRLAYVLVRMLARRRRLGLTAVADRGGRR